MTVAELTSLEELLRTMMDDGQIHSDIISKLWQVYSGLCFTELRRSFDELMTYTGVDKEIPRMQRRGAIIVLGMLALAKREIVTDRLETLLKIGLGALGKV